ncbi:uncharacterized protein LOC123671968 [Harmonia axyridis]|uniref:uncharacterized protein LOC123671968 n=1 Tax=Harmonia axyridis TaxID=115357 RepID=UPI001E278A6D|nr:uncharacterized protein LOC123671968 [Harmonia axyridis]
MKFRIMAIVVTEREVLIEVLQRYKSLPCLWDTTHESYSNREARNQALEILKDYYSKYNKNISVNDLKKKLENMRAVYRREKNKMDGSKSGGDGSKKYQTSLWYYQYFSFLHEKKDSSTKESDNFTDSKQENETNEPERKKTKYSNESQSNELPKDQEDVVEGTHNSINYSGGENSANTFGRYVSSQITEITNKLQRCLAEKLIGDILFHAKLEQLNFDTRINLNSYTGPFQTRSPYSSLPYATPHTNNSYTQSSFHQSPNSFPDLQSPYHHVKSSQSVSLSPSPIHQVKSQSISLSPSPQNEVQSPSPTPSSHYLD